MTTVWPIPPGVPNNSSAVVWPRTATLAPAAFSPSVKNRPADRVRARTVAQSGVVATAMVVQVVVPAVRTWDDDRTGATLAMSGATLLSARAAASVSVREVADPSPPRTPPLVEL